MIFSQAVFLILAPLYASAFNFGSAILPLPGYAADGGFSRPDSRLAAHPGEGAFPLTCRQFDGEYDPLDSFGSREDDLRDALASPPSSAALQAGLRAPGSLTRMAAVRNASRPRGVQSVPYLAALMLRLDEPVSLRATAALGLGRIGDGIAINALVEALHDPAPEVRYAAALSLGRMPADGVATRLERVLLEDPAWQPRYAAAISLGRGHRAFSATPLAESLTGDPAWQVRQQAARSLEEIGTKHAAHALVLGLKDPEPVVRAASGEALANIGNSDQRRLVTDALHVEPDPSVRAVLARASLRAHGR